MPVNLEQGSTIVAILLLAFFAQALKEIGIPSPGLTQSLLLYAGYQFSCGEFYFGFGIILFTFLGSLCGACFIFCLAKSGESKLLAKIERFVMIKQGAMEKAGKMLTSYSFLTVAIGRLIPGLLVPTSIVAGFLKMPFGNFLKGIIFSLSLWMVVLITLGSTFRYITPQINYSPDRFILFLGILIAIGVLTGTIYIWKKNKSSQKR